MQFRGLQTGPEAAAHPPDAVRNDTRNGKAISYLLMTTKQSGEDATGSKPTPSDGSFITETTFLSLKRAGVLCMGSAEPFRTPGTFPEPSWSQLSTGTRLSPAFFTPRVIYHAASLCRSHLPDTCSRSTKQFVKRR